MKYLILSKQRKLIGCLLKNPSLQVFFNNYIYYTEYYYDIEGFQGQQAELEGQKDDDILNGINKILDVMGDFKSKLDGIGDINTRLDDIKTRLLELEDGRNEAEIVE